MRYHCLAKMDQKSQNIAEQIDLSLTAAGFVNDVEMPELVICVGGDGTFLHAVHQYQHILAQVGFVGLHTGNLGFFNDYISDELDLLISDIINKIPHYEYRRMVEACVDQTHKFYALNEIRIENNIKTQIVEVQIDDFPFEVIRGSGVCLSTQAGSTAYNRSLNGAILDEHVDFLQLTEVTPIHNSQFRTLGSSLVLNQSRVVKITAADFDYSVLCYDHLFYELKNAKSVVCQLSQQAVRFARYREKSYLQRLVTLF
jgi:NAD+ kinase